MPAHASSTMPDEVRAALDAFRRIVQALRTSSREAERRAGLSGAQLFALQQLAATPGASVNDLAARTFTHQSSVSVVVRRLTERRLVAKVVADEDRRRVQLALTDAGRAALRRAPEPVQERLIAGIAALPDAERRTLTGALASLARAMASPDAHPPMFFEEGRGGRRAARPNRRRAARGRQARRRSGGSN